MLIIEKKTLHYTKVILIVFTFNLSDFRHTLTVQHTGPLERKTHNPSSPNSPPGSPGISRLRAIAREYCRRINVGKRTGLVKEPHVFGDVSQSNSSCDSVSTRSLFYI